jgi:cupin fold WbuC family metalloprotein
MVTLIDVALLDSLTAQARANARLRQHLNFHASYEEPSQRLLNAMEPGSYIRPHRHLTDPKPEAFVGIRGRMALLIFNEAGGVEGVVCFGPGEEVVGAEVPPGIWHTVVSLKAGSVFYETKPGPFNPISKKDMAPWAPEEGSAEGVAYLQSLVSRATAESGSG